jgi:membrane-associated phospholipid phosphatase
MTFWTVLALYAVLTVCVLFKSPILSLDHYLAALHLQAHNPQYRPWIDGYVIFGQRGPATLAFLPFFVWIAWRQRSTRPLVMLGTALLLLNVTVGVVKYAIGRVGPMYHPDSDVHRIFDGGNIYPSGHVSNVVVLYGLIAWLAPRFRKLFVGVAVFLAVTVGLCTVYLRTHWFSDVVGGWLAGALVLLILPTVMPYTERWADRGVAWARVRYARLRRRRVRVRVADQLVEVEGVKPVQGNATPVSSSAQPQSRDAVPVSLDRLDERTRVG